MVSVGENTCIWCIFIHKSNTCIYAYIYTYIQTHFIFEPIDMCIYIYGNILSINHSYTYLERDQDNIGKRFKFSFLLRWETLPYFHDTPEFCSNNRSNCQEWEYFRKGCSVLGYLVWVSSFSPWVVVSCRLVQKKQTGHFWRSWLMSMSSRCSWIKGSISWTSMIDWPTTIMFQTDVYMFGKNPKKSNKNYWWNLSKNLSNSGQVSVSAEGLPFAATFSATEEKSFFPRLIC